MTIYPSIPNPNYFVDLFSWVHGLYSMTINVSCFTIGSAMEGGKDARKETSTSFPRMVWNGR